MIIKGKKSYKKALKKKNTLIKKAYKLREILKFEVLLFVRRQGQITIFKSINNKS